jgi:hypothetical protein
MPRNLDSSSSLSRPLCAWDDASLMTTLRHHNDCDMMPHHSLIQQVTSHNQPQQALIITYYEYGHARKLRKPNKQTAAPSTEHRAPSTEHRAPSTEHRAPSTEHRAPTNAQTSFSRNHRSLLQKFLSDFLFVVTSYFGKEFGSTDKTMNMDHAVLLTSKNNSMLQTSFSRNHFLIEATYNKSTAAPNRRSKPFQKLCPPLLST